nr:putative nuclease HARBI1 [Ipomoea batatas]GME19492.1 putative nuclease HARBI1 [Ipomoea batatas]
MGDTHQEKSKGKNKVNGNYALWAPEESNELLQLMVDAIKNGWRDSSGGLSKLTVEKRILPALNENLGCQRSYAIELDSDESPSPLPMNDVDNFEQLFETQEQQREHANEWRAKIALDMWRDTQQGETNANQI